MSSTGYIGPDGKYIRTNEAHKLADDVSSTYKGWSHDKQRKDHGRDIIQPYTNGQPNPAFIEQYPEQSLKYGFIKE